MLRFEIHPAEIVTFHWKDKSGSERTGYKQPAFVHLPGKPYPVETSLRIDDPSKAYPAGVYELDPKSFWVDRYGGLAITPVLIQESREQIKK